MMEWFLWASIPCVFFCMWIYTAWLSQSFPTLQGKRIALLIAHPDDEAMFFAPTLLALSRPELGNHIRILCLTSGDSDGLGEIRKKELVKSGLQLGLRSEDSISIVEDSNFPDSITTDWDPKLVADLLTKSFAPKMSKVPPGQKPETDIDILITFDRHGISYHPNHRSLYFGARTFLQALVHRRPGWESPIKLYTLTSTGIFRKYLSIFDAPVSVLGIIFSRKEAGPSPAPLLFVSGPGDYRIAQRAMTSAHKSQMVWFRWGWIGMSRYMAINTLRKEKVI